MLVQGLFVREGRGGGGQPLKVPLFKWFTLCSEGETTFKVLLFTWFLHLAQKPLDCSELNVSECSQVTACMCVCVLCACVLFCWFFFWGGRGRSGIPPDLCRRIWVLRVQFFSFFSSRVQM